MILDVWEVAVQEGFIATDHVCWQSGQLQLLIAWFSLRQCLQWGIILTLLVKASL